MSEFDIATMQHFTNVCNTYILFIKEYGQVESQEKELHDFCEYVIANKPDKQLKEQFD